MIDPISAAFTLAGISIGLSIVTLIFTCRMAERTVQAINTSISQSDEMRRQAADMRRSEKNLDATSEKLRGEMEELRRSVRQSKAS